MCLSFSGSVASEALEDSSVSWLHPAHRQPGCRGDLVAGVGQFGKRDRVLVPLYSGLGHTYTSGGTHTRRDGEEGLKSLNNPLTSALSKPPHTDLSSPTNVPLLICMWAYRLLIIY